MANTTWSIVFRYRGRAVWASEDMLGHTIYAFSPTGGIYYYSLQQLIRSIGKEEQE